METFISIATQVFVLVIGVSVHESAHGAAALACGDTTARDAGRITLNPLRHVDPFGSVILPFLLAITGAPVFGWAKPVPVAPWRARSPRLANFVISAAGPLSNLALAVGFAALASRLAPWASTDSALIEALVRLCIVGVVVNVVLAVFNLLPIPPLDGFGMLESVLPERMSPAVALLRRYGMPLLLIIMLSGGLDWILRPALRTVAGYLLGRG